jgi:hypothetical protein
MAAAPGAVECRHLAGGGVVIKGKAIAADAGRDRLDDIEHGGGRYGGIRRGAARLQDGQTCLCRQRLAGGDHAMPGQNVGAA